MEKRAFRFAARKIADWMIEGGKEHARMMTWEAIILKKYAPKTLDAFRIAFGN